MAAIRESEIIVGYGRYLRLIADLTRGKKKIASGMRQEIERCRRALALAAQGRVVSLVSSGDPGIYGMAGLALEMAAGWPARIPIEIIPGVTAAAAAAAKLGAPLMADFAVISLSDLLVPWKKIRRRLAAAAESDLAVALYNPRSKTRQRPFLEAVRIFRKERPAATPVGIVTDATCARENIILTDLAHVLDHEVGMRSLVIIGNSEATVLNGNLVTRRGYKLV